jgi:hypothetical protein
VFFACIYVPNFLAQAAVRLDPTAAASPFAVVAGDPPQVRVLAVDDCLYGLQATVPHLTQSSLHRCPQAISTSSGATALKASRNPILRMSSSIA